MKKLFRRIAAVYAFLCFILISVISYYNSKLPDSFSCDRNKNIKLNTAFGITARNSDELSAALAVKTAPETSSVTLMLMNIIPVKEAELIAVDRPELTPCGKPFGIKMMMDGVMVIKTGTVNTEKGPVSPAEDAGIQKGDIIESINGKAVYSNKDIESVISEHKSESIDICISRENAELNVSITPVRSNEDCSYRLGLWVRDSSSGIGTVTYCDCKSGTFGGLGHPVCDTDTGKIIPLFSGEIMNVNISGVKKGCSGTPGELKGFFSGTESCGTLSFNNRYGVFGEIDKDFTNEHKIPMALKHEVQTGNAVIYSTLEGTEPKEYDIKIEKIDYNNTDSAKNMIIKVTDPELIEKSGGIVQGMSGSPIIQNNMLVGAVTHVFVNDPQMGYAVFCENMYDMSHAS